MSLGFLQPIDAGAANRSAAATPAPVVSLISPNGGPLGGGVAVTIQGSNFTGATSVHFGTEPVTVTVNSDTSISVTSPAFTTPGAVDVTVITPGGSSPTSAADLFTYGDTYTQVSTRQYSLANSDGTTWQDIDATGLSLSITPSVNSNAILSGNADLWTANAGFNQDIGISVNGTVVAWKESGGFAGTFSPNAAFVQAVVPMNAGTTYTVRLQWKTNRAALGATIYAGAGPIAGQFSPTRISARLVPAASTNLATTATTQQYQLANSDGSTWTDMDATGLSLTYTPAVSGLAVLTGNSDLWTANAGFNQDIGISVNGSVVGWKESGGFAGTFSPNAALVQVVVAMTAATSYTVKLQWKTNKSATGASIYAGAGPIGGLFSPTRLTLLFQPSGTGLTDMASSQQYQLTGSDGSSWMDVDSSSLQTTVTPPSNCLGVLSANVDLWTASAGYNQDIGIAVNSTIAAWKESGGYAGTFSPNAAYVQTVVPMTGGSPYTVKLQWKTNKPAGGVTIYAAAGSPGAFSPTRLTVALVACAGLPGPPANVRALGGNGQADVSWTAPPDHGSPITSYTVTPSPAAGAPVNVSAATTSVTMTGLTNGTAYTFAVTATNSAGTGPAGVSNSVVVGAPGAPTNVRGVSGDAQATVSWTPPVDNGSAITGYTVTTIPATSSVQVGPSITSTTVTGLTNGTTYTFQVTASNANGMGPPGASSAVTIGVPGAPTNVRATAGNAQATVSWTPPSGNGSAITSYTVTPVPPTSSGPVTVTAPATTATVTGLTNGTAYRFQVTATNANGTGPAGSSSPIIAGAPGAPTNIRVTGGNTQATVSWTPPSDNGSPISSYTITATPALPSPGQVTVPGSTVSTTITGLTNGTSYTFHVAATNANGTGQTGSSSPLIIGAPGTPTNIRATGGNTQAGVSWTPPADNGSPVTSYTVTPVPPTGSSVTVTAPATSATVTGLTNGTTYKFQVTATNANGTGPAGTSNAVTAGAPFAPTSVQAAAGPGSATITWSAPPDNGSPIAFYTVTATPALASPVTVSAPTTTATVTGLTSGTTYIFHVTATNGYGTGPPGNSNPVTPS